MKWLAGGIALGWMLACSGGAPTERAPGAEKPDDSERGKRGKRGKRGGGAASCCERAEGPGGSSGPYWTMGTKAQCAEDGGSWVTRAECEPACCAVEGGGATEPIYSMLPSGSCKYYCCGVSQTPADASECT